MEHSWNCADRERRSTGGEGGDLSTKILIGTRSKPGLRSESLGVAGRLQKSTVCED